MELNRAEKKGKPLSITDYAADLERVGERVFTGGKGTIWISHGLGAITRLPFSHLASPDLKEVSQLLWRGPTLVADYIQEPNDSHPANTWLYICTDQAYTLDKLVPTMRRNVRRGLKELRIVPINSDELLAHGVKAFCDTRRRNGLSDGTPEEFKKRFTLRARSQGHVFHGAWKDDQLAAFLSIIEVDNWAEIEGCFSMNDLLKTRPNEALFYSILNYYLVEKKCQVVTYGLSSIQTESNVAGLHAFKAKVGFLAKPVHRVFVIHPLLRPFANQIVLLGLDAALRLRPDNRVLRKVRGMLALMLGRQ